MKELKHTALIDSIKTIINDYERRLKTVMSMINSGGNDLTINRLGTKASCYRTIIAELEKVIRDNS